MKICKCGCGEKVKKEGNKFIQGHNARMPDTILNFVQRIKKNGISRETREKISKANLGRKHSEETKKKMSESAKGKQNSLGRIHSKETKNKISLKLKGNTNAVGFKHTDATKRKLSEFHRADMLSEETRQRMKNAMKNIGILIGKEA